ncbi:MAG: prolyl oligopeptidase family serine peptidase, partial [Pyrinomonadaceae bacterium]
MMRQTKRMQKLLICALLFVVPTFGMGAAVGQTPAPNVWTPELMMKVKGVGAASSTPPGAVRVSPDGKRVAYTVTTSVMTPEKSEYVTQIHGARIDGGDSFQVTYAEKSSSNPRWSPDSKWLAFTSSRSGKNNLYLLRLDGGEAEQLTDVKTSVSNFAWSPDNRSIAFTMSDQLSDDEEKGTKGKDDWRWVDESVKQNRLYVVTLQKDAEGKRAPRKLTKSDYHVGGDFDWSPDGKSIVFSHTKGPKADYWTTSDVSVIDVASGEAKTIAATPAAEAQPAFSPDGKTIAMSVSDNPPRWARSATIALVPTGGGASKALASSYDGQPNLIGWAADGKNLYFSEARGTGTRLYTASAATGAITEVNKSGEVLNGIDLNHSRTMLGFVMQSSERPPEAFVSRAGDFAPVQISRANADIPQLPLGKTEVASWKSTDGKEIEGLLTYPVNYQPGKRVPLLLVIHGGPAGVFTQTFIASRGAYPIAAFASRGYAVLRPNPRGSSGYGADFRRANVKDWGRGDFNDLMTGVDHVVKM